MTRLEFERVEAKLRDAIVEFCLCRYQMATAHGRVPRFKMDELRKYCINRLGVVAPDSPGRVLRSLRQTGVVSYVVTNRRRSEYTIKEVKENR